MADRYWVGGTASWDGTAGTKWAATSGGPGGETVPTTADDVFFDVASGANTVTIATGNTGAKSVNCTGFTGTLTGNGALTVAGSFTLVVGMTHTYSGVITFTGTGTITSAGKTLTTTQIFISGAGIVVTLADALTITLTLNLTQGTLDSANYNISCSSLSSTSGVSTLNLGSSTMTLTAGGTIWNSSTNFTLNSGTSTIILNPAGGATIQAASINFYNLNFSTAQTGLITFTLTGTVACNNLSITAPGSAGVRSVTFNSPLTINGVLSTVSTAGNRRVWFQSVTYGVAVSLVVNGSTSLTNADFRDVYVIGTAAPISGTRIGDLRGNTGITFSAPKTVYWSNTGGAGWSTNSWTNTPGDSPSLDYFPMAQDTAVISNTGLNSGNTITLDNVIPYIGTIDMSSRTNSMTLNISVAYTVYGDWKNGAGTSFINFGALTFSGRKTQTITSAGKTFPAPITVDTFGGTVELADAYVSQLGFTVTNGTFDTKGFSFQLGSTLSSSNSNVRTIKLNNSICNIPSVNFAPSTNLTFDAGTSSIISASGGTPAINGGTGQTFYNVSFTEAQRPQISGQNTFNNLTVTNPNPTAALVALSINGNQTINGTFTIAGANAARRVFVCSDTIGTPRTVTANSISADNCDFRDIIIAGAAAGVSPVRAGDCGGNSGIVFPAPKTVYWNLAGSQNWNATAWAIQSSGTPAIENFPLPQDTAIFDDAGAAGTVNFNDNWNVGTLDASLRTVAMTLGTGTGSSPTIYGNWKFGTGVTSSTSGSGSYNFAKSGVQTITSNGVVFGRSINISGPSNTNYVQLADALSLSTATASTLFLNSGTFDAGTSNVTIASFSAASATGLRTLKMGSGTWTLTGTGTVWNASTVNFNFYKGTANILLSDTSTSDRTFSGASLSYNKLTIGGTTGTSTTYLISSNQFTEIASIKTVAHTIDFGATGQTFGAWTVTGTPGNVVTLSGTATGNSLVGSCTSGIDYLAMGSIGFATTSPGEFYAGANSTGTAAAPVYRTAKPADSVRYWVGGTGSWSDTARWSTESGGLGGASVPRSHDDVVFNAASNATAYTVTVDSVTGGIRMKSLTIDGPASGNMTLAGSTAIAGIHGNITLPATGLTRTYNGVIVLSGSTPGKTITTNGVALANQITINGVGCEWSLGSNLNSINWTVIITNGSLNLAGYSLTAAALSSNNTNKRTIKLGTGTHTFNSNPIIFGASETQRADLTLDAGTSQINCNAGGFTLEGNNQTFYNVSFTATGSYSPMTISGANTFNNLTFNSLQTQAYGRTVTFNANQTITGTLTVLASLGPGGRNIFQSSTVGTGVTLTCGSVVMSDVDFRDITIAGTAAPASGTRIGDCKGNSGIVFTPATTRYWNIPGGSDWRYGWANSSGGTASTDNFPLPQDTCIIENTGLNSGQSINMDGVAGYSVGTIDMSSRTLPMILNTGGSNFLMLGNWITGTGTTISGSGRITFAGRGNQTITTAGNTIIQQITINSPGGSVTLQDSYTYNSGTTINNPDLVAGTFNANGYNVTSAGTGTFVALNSTGVATRTLAMGSGTWTFAGGGAQLNIIGSNITVTGTATIKYTSSLQKNFNGGGINYGDITLEQAGSGTLIISGNNTFKTITNSYNTIGATSIIFASGTSTRIRKFDLPLTNATNPLSLIGTSTTPTLIFTGVGIACDLDYLNVSNIRAYPVTNSWYVRSNSVLNSFLGFQPTSAPALPPNASFIGFF